MRRSAPSKFSRSLLALGLAALGAAAAGAAPAPGRTEGGDAGEAAALHLPFRGYGLTADYQLVKVFGDATYYTIWPLADLSSLPWHTATTGDDDGGLASDPWNWRYLYVVVPVNASLSDLYRFDLTTNSLSYVTPFPSYSTPTGWNYTLQGLGARCLSKFADLHGGVGFYSHRRTHPVHLNYVHEITSTGAETTILGPIETYHGGDNTQELFGGAYWFTYEGYDGVGNSGWGVKTLKGPMVPMGSANDGGHPTGILAYGSGTYYVSVEGAKMYKVATGSGASAQLSYIPWGVPAYPTAPDLIDLSNPTNYCSPILP